MCNITLQKGICIFFSINSTFQIIQNFFYLKRTYVHFFFIEFVNMVCAKVKINITSVDML